jgi:RHS repeat-associated protein
VVTGAPGTNLSLPLPDALVPAQTRTVYDGAGRVAASVQLVHGAEKWRTTTRYGGDRTDVTPPDGGTPTSTVTDARGRTVALRQYHGATASGSFDATRYAYDRRGQLVTITDPAGNHIDYGYDLRGRQTSVDHPDKGETSAVYSDAGDMLSSTDARDKVLAYVYDSFGRKIEQRETSTTGTLRAKWEYDTLPGGTAVRGQAVRSTRWFDGAAYVNQVLSMDDGYRTTSSSVTVPEAGTTPLSYVYSYNVDGTPSGMRLPAVGALPTEQLSIGYTNLGQPETLHTNLSPTGESVFLVNGTSYTEYGELSVIGRRYNTSGWVDSKREYEVGTRRLVQLLSKRAIEPSQIADLRYTYDPIGNIKQIADVPTSGAPDTQCFEYDRKRRLTEAWTPATGDCDAVRSVAALGGPAPYWQSFTYDVIGNRLSLVDRTVAATTSRTYIYPDAGADQPHTLRTVQTTGAGAGTASYTYDESGNTLTQPGTTLIWDVEGRLESSTRAGATTRFRYDADGNRIARIDPDGTRTVYLPGGQELRITSGGAVSGTRYYTHAGEVIGVRTGVGADGAGLSWLVNDHQGTASIAVDAATLAVTTRRQKPFGDARGAAAAWPGDKGFVGGTNDPTGTVHLGAREYDPGTGRFLSFDPAVDTNDPQQMHGYGYGNSSPVTMSDPDGLKPYEGDGPPSNACTGSCATYSQYYTEQARKPRLCGCQPGPRQPNWMPDWLPVKWKPVKPKPPMWISRHCGQDEEWSSPEACQTAWNEWKATRDREFKRAEDCNADRAPVQDCSSGLDVICYEWRSPECFLWPKDTPRPVGDLADPKKPRHLPGELYFSFGFCIYICIGLQATPSGGAQFQVGASTGVGVNATVGWTSAPASQQGAVTYQGCATYGVGVCGSGGLTKNSEVPVWVGGGVSVGVGVSARGGGADLGGSYSFDDPRKR